MEIGFIVARQVTRRQFLRLADANRVIDNPLSRHVAVPARPVGFEEVERSHRIRVVGSTPSGSSRGSGIRLRIQGGSDVNTGVDVRVALGRLTTLSLAFARAARLLGRRRRRVHSILPAPFTRLLLELAVGRGELVMSRLYSMGKGFPVLYRP